MISDNTADYPCALEAKDLSVILGGQKVLDVPLLQVHRNEVLMVIGPNGSGKTTLLLCLASLLKPASGTIVYKGMPATDSRNVLELRRRLAVVFQESLLLNSSVWDNVTLGLRLRGVKGNEARARAKKWLERFGIAHLAKRQARMLSSGEGKRVSLARAFVLQPELLLLDEPFNALDTPTQRSLLEDFENVLRETKTTTVMVTHDRNEAMSLGDRVVVLMNGAISQLGTPDDVFGFPADEEVASFVGVENIIGGKIVSSRDKIVTVKVGENIIEAVSDYPEGTEVSACIRPEDITLARSKITSSARNSFAGRITRTVSFGALARVEIDCGFPLVSLVTKRSAEELDLTRDRQVYATFKATAIHIIKR
ncbi:MAG: ABC transporter ATP-binding protein [Dehalococcoidales bacterium]|nr:ABC transporter ATP-binding protein [Dehalococcoidales bacterium]